MTYHDPANTSQRSKSAHLEEEDQDLVRIADFTINIDVVTKQQLISMRKFLPADEYRLLKNRKSARICRKKKKEERGGMQQTIEQLIKDNRELKDRLEQTERILQESQQALYQRLATHATYAGMNANNQQNRPQDYHHQFTGSTRQSSGNGSGAGSGTNPIR